MRYEKLFVILCLPVIWYFSFVGHQGDNEIATTQVVTSDINTSVLAEQTQATVVEDVLQSEEPYSFGGEVVLTDDLMIDIPPTDLEVVSESSDKAIKPTTPAPEFCCPDFILYENYVSESIVTDVLSHYCMIPENVRTWFQAYGYQIHIQNDINTLYGFSYKIKAVTVPDEKMVYVDNRSGIGASIVHEVGHAVAYANPDIVCCDDFQAIYSEELQSFISITNTHVNNYSTVWEYFAEAYECCILHGSSMQSACPKTYDYIMAYMNSL